MNDKKDNICGRRIKILREKKKLTQDQLAKLLHVSRSTILKYETGRQIPPIDRICDIADIFEVSTDYLYGCIEFAPPLSKLGEIFYENMTYEQLILQLSDLSEDSKRFFISILERMIDTNATETD